ncbi:hypothetical protein [Shigella dysenteriae]|nr:hypothetical protein [Shigella dysenteriae]WNT51135.1 hypothetical protein PWP84_01195 [Shigella dysenteriae]
MNVNAGHERTSKARIIHQIQLIRGITEYFSHPGWFCNKTFFITFPVITYFRGDNFIHAKKYPTNFHDPLDISEYDSNSTKDSRA